MQDAIQEFNVNIANFPPEYGLASGAVISIITRLGTNDFRGRAFWFFRDDALDASNVEGQPPPELRRQNPGGTLGGPIVRDRTWFFYAVEAFKETRGINLDLSRIPDIIKSGFATPSVPDGEPFDAKPETRRFSQFVKVNHRLSPAHQLFVSSNWNNNRQDTLVRPRGWGSSRHPPAACRSPARRAMSPRTSTA